MQQAATDAITLIGKIINWIFTSLNFEWEIANGDTITVNVGYIMLALLSTLAIIGTLTSRPISGAIQHREIREAQWRKEQREKESGE